MRVGLLTYPVLMAADILLYDAEKVPVGDDQRQHLELARNIAVRFNARYGEVFVVPEGEVPKVGARVMDLQHPERKMSKSVSSPAGVITIADTPDEIERKVRRAVTDTGAEVRYAPEEKSGVSNLLELLSAATGTPPDKLAGDFPNYGSLKAATAEALVGMLAPVRERLLELRSDPAAIDAALQFGARKAEDVANATLRRARDAVGLLARRPPGD